MPLLDDLKQRPPEREIRRRQFLGLVGGGALAAASAGTVVAGVRYMEPAVYYEAETRFRVVRPEEVSIGEVIVLEREGVFVVRADAGFYAMSSTCTHLGCRTNYQPAQSGIFCPCHGSHFDLRGTVTEGPAPRPLPRYELTLDQGYLVVDVGREVPRDQLLRVG